MTCAGLLKKIEALDIDSIVVDSVSDTEQDYVELQQEQMFAGVKADGNDITPFYTPYTVEQKIKKGQPYDRVTLNDTGDFYNSMRIENISINSFSPTSTDPKTAELEAKYGDKIFGLDADVRKYYTFGAFFKSVKEKIESITGLKFS